MDRTDLKLELVFDEEKRSFVTNLTVGGGDTITRVEPWMLEAIIVAVHTLNQARERMEAWVLQEFVKGAALMREAKRQVASDTNLPPVPVVVDLTKN